MAEPVPKNPVQEGVCGWKGFSERTRDRYPSIIINFYKPQPPIQEGTRLDQQF